MPMIVGAVMGASSASSQKDTQDYRGGEIECLKAVSTGVWSGQDESPAEAGVVEMQDPPPIDGPVEDTEGEAAEEEPHQSFANLEWIDGTRIESSEGAEAEASGGDPTDEVSDPTNEAQSGVRDFRAWLYATFDDPSFSRLAYIVSIALLVCIAVSIIAIVIETLPSLRDDDEAGKVFIGIEWTSSIVFTIEYLCKFVPVRQKCLFARQPMNIIDLVAILPFYVELICSAAGVNVDISILRLLRVVRIFRVFKLSKYSTNIQLCATVMLDSKDSLGLMVFMLSIVGVVFSSFEFFCEKGTWDENLGYYVNDDGNRSRYDSIPATMWWCVVTVMTVGYGDLAPITVPGKLVAAGAMVCAIVIMALPISVVGSNFSRAWSEAKAKEDKKDESQQLGAAFEMLVDALGDHSNILEALLSDVSRLSESLSHHLAEAHRIYVHELGRASRDASAVQDPDGKLKDLVTTIVQEQKQLEEAIEQVAAAQDVEFEAEVKRSLEQCVEMSQLMLKHQELSANVVGMEAVIFGRRLS